MIYLLSTMTRYHPCFEYFIQKRTIRKFWIAIAFIITTFSLSTVSHAEDLLSVFDLALCNDPKIKSARATLFAAQEALPQARALFLPVIAGTANNTYYNKVYQGGRLRISNISLPITQTQFNWEQSVYSLTLTQPFFYYEQWVQLAKADVQVKQANATFAAAEQDLILRTITAYFNVLKAFDALKYTKALRKAYFDTYQQTIEQNKAGVISTKADVEIAKARYISAEAQEISAANTLAIQKQLLLAITCIDVNSFALLKENIELTPPMPANVNDWVCKALEQNMNLLAARFQTEAAKQDIKLNISGHLPTVNFNGAYIRSSPALDLFQTPANTDTYIGVQVSVPIFSGGSVLSKTRQAKHQFEQNYQQMETVRRQVETDTVQSFLNVVSQTSLMSANKAAALANSVALEATRASYKAGLKTIVDVLDAQSNLVQAEQNYANARYDYIIDRAQLKQAAGMLCPEEILLINSWLAKGCD